LSGDDKIEVDGKVLEICRGGRFKCLLENGQEIIAYSSGKIKKHSIKIVVGDKVRIELSPYDLTQGRIVYRER
jgi:translation initiation factor IF-1